MFFIRYLNAVAELTDDRLSKVTCAAIAIGNMRQFRSHQDFPTTQYTPLSCASFTPSTHAHHIHALTRCCTTIIHHISHITHHTPHTTHHTSHITHHTSHITRHTSHITHHTSHITPSPAADPSRLPPALSRRHAVPALRLKTLSNPSLQQAVAVRVSAARCR